MEEKFTYWHRVVYFSRLLLVNKKSTQIAHNSVIFCTSFSFRIRLSFPSFALLMLLFSASHIQSLTHRWNECVVRRFDSQFPFSFFVHFFQFMYVGVALWHVQYLNFPIHFVGKAKQKTLKYNNKADKNTNANRHKYIRILHILTHIHTYIEFNDRNSKILFTHTHETICYEVRLYHFGAFVCVCLSVYVWAWVRLSTYTSSWILLLKRKIAEIAWGQTTTLPKGP